MPFIIQQGLQVYTQSHVWGADAPMVFLDAAEAEPITEADRARGYRKTQVVAFDGEYEAWQLSGFRAAANAVRDYACRIEQDGALHCASVNGGPPIARWLRLLYGVKEASNG